MSAAKNAVTAFEIKRALSEKHWKDFFITECKSGPTQIAAAGTLKILDGLAIKKSWTAPCFTGYEVKVSRSDFLRDAKFYTYEELCNCLYIVCPKGMIDRTELPESIGLMYYDPEKKTLTTRKRAIYRKIEYSPELLLYIIFSRLDSDRIPFFSDRRQYFEAYVAEIDKYAIQTTQHNFPDTIQLGDAFQVRDDGWKIESVEPEEAVTAPAVIKPREAKRSQAVSMSNAVIKYPGAKWGVAPWVISHFPEHRSYLEPFFGSGAVLFTKSRSAIETVGDIDGEIVNLFEWIKTDPERLAHEIYFTPYARAEYDRAWAEQYTEKDSFKRAVNFYIRMMQGHGFRTTGEKVGWKNDVQGREAAYAAKSWCKTPEIIMEAAERLRGVQIENRPAVELIRRFNYPNVLIYADPPYLLSTRQRRKQYRHEMTDDDHVELLEALKAHKGPAIISGYDSDLYNRELKGWYKDGRTSFTQTASRRKEIIWMNFEPAAQMDMFREG